MEDLRLKYDALCYATMVNVRSLSADNPDRIVFRNFNSKNKEHLFVLALTMACWHILGEKQVAVDCNTFARRRLTKKYHELCEIDKAREDDLVFINVPEMLEFMREHAENLCGKNFTFGDIYDAYYNERD
jgi:hypothetical protein